MSWRDTYTGAFVLGVIDPIRQGGGLDVGRSFNPEDRPDWDDWNETYDRGANVGEWLWDLTHFRNVARWPWIVRNDQ